MAGKRGTDRGGQVYKDKSMMRVQVHQWWELEAANGERAVEYSAFGDDFGTGTPRRFNGTDFEVTRALDGTPFEDGLSEVERVKASNVNRQALAPFKVFRVTRYRLAKAPPCFSCEKAPQKYKTGLCEACHGVALRASRVKGRKK